MQMPICMKKETCLLCSYNSKKKDNIKFSRRWLTDESVNLISAGRDTIPSAMSWMFYLLAMNPCVQAKLCAEVDAKFPTGDVMPELASFGIGEMPYLQGVLYETLRLYPPFDLLFRESVADDVLPDGTPVAKGTMVFCHPYVMGRDPERYANPMVVIPERWIPFKEPDRCDFPVFGSAPRICQGINMATLMIKIVACTLLQRYTFELAPGEAEKVRPRTNGFTLSVSNSIDMKSLNLWLIPKRRV